MDTRQLIDDLVADLDPMARPVVTRYLRELAAALPGSRRARAAILTEIADGLIEQITNTNIPDPVAAAETAVHTFGGPHNLAAQFAHELTGKAAHRTGFALVSSGPLIGTCWLLALTSGQPPAMTVTLPQRIAGMLSALPLIPVLLLIIIPAALVAVAGAGRASRLLPVTTDTAGLAGTGRRQRMRHRRCRPDRARNDGSRGLVTAADCGRRDQHCPAQPGRRGGATLRPAPGRGLIAPFRTNARQVSGTPTSAGNTQYATVGNRSHTGSCGPLST